LRPLQHLRLGPRAAGTRGLPRARCRRRNPTHSRVGGHRGARSGW
jgi:hypothetical protein